jgi:hypothetical protein
VLFLTARSTFFLRFLSASQGATEKIKRENDVHLRQLAKQST